MAGMAVTASGALIAWDRAAAPLRHDDLRGDVTVPAFLAVAVGGWTLMVVAMMLPTSAPLVSHFAVVVRRRHHPGLLVALLIAGYLAVWVSFGVVAHLGDLRVHDLSHSVPAIDDRPWLVLAATLALAGGYQFTGLKYRCLRACRSPRHFILTHWHGRRPAADALRLGVDHGLFCLGCCWALMLLMFAVAWASVPVMLALAGVMAAEKNGLAGDWLTAALGYGLLAASAAVVAAGLV